MIPNETVTITHDDAAHRFETTLDGHEAYAEYTLLGNLMTFTHTIVPGPIEGQGIAAALARAGLAHASERGYQVIPQCPYIAAYIERHGAGAEKAG